MLGFKGQLRNREKTQPVVSKLKPKATPRKPTLTWKNFAVNTALPGPT